MAPRRIGEFELIARYFRAARQGFRRRAAAESDNAFLAADPRRDLVVKTDTIVSGVHFLADEKPELVAHGRCASACPISRRRRRARTLPALAVARARLERALDRGFRARARADQRRFGIVLCGGDTDATPGPTHRHRHRLRPRAARQGPGPRRRAGRRRALGQRHDRRCRARPARARGREESRAREALSPAAAAHGRWDRA
jgi:thiamine-monophosphate kinase